MNSRFQSVLRGEVTSTPPIWMMRQAGRYHSHYQNLKKSYSFSQLCKQPKLAAEVALGPVQDFDFDLAILFSDLLFPLEALGMDLSYDNGGPELGQRLDLGVLHNFSNLETAVAKMQFQAEAMTETRKLLPKDKSLIGFVGGPWTLFVYAVEGSHKGHLLSTKRAARDLFARFCEHMVPLLQRNIQLQLDAGAEVVMVLDTAAGELAPVEFSTWTLEPLAQILNGFSGRVGYYAKGGTSDLTRLMHARLKNLAFGLGFDHRFSLPEILVKQQFRFVQGNFDQTLLHLPPSEFESVFRQFLEPFSQLAPAQRRGWVCGVGHGLLPTTPEVNVRNFVRIVREVIHE